MTDINKMNRTWLCSVLFLDIVNYSSQSVDRQIKWKERFNAYLANAIRDVPEDERVILDTGDGAATCFLGAPEAAMFSALEMWHSLLDDEREQQPPFRVRIGINLGPVKLVRDINGAPNAIGDGMNAGQRVMSFAAENQILVSQSYFEVVSRLSDDYKKLFTLKGVETDKHIREHTVYHLSPPGAQHSPVSSPSHQPATPLPAAASQQNPASPAGVVQPARENRPENQARGRRSIPLVVGAIALVVVAAAAAWRVSLMRPIPAGSGSAPAKESVSVPPAAQGQIGASSPAVAPVAAAAPIGTSSNSTSLNSTSPNSTSLNSTSPNSTSRAAAAPRTAPVSQPRSVASSNKSPSPDYPPSVPNLPAVVSTTLGTSTEEPAPHVRAPGEAPFAASPPVLQNVPAADQDTARDLRQRYALDASRAATAWRNAEEMRRNLTAKGMSLNSQTAASLDRLGFFLDEAAEALRGHKWDDALSSLQAVEAETQKVAKSVGN